MARLQTVLINHSEKSYIRFLTEYRYPVIWQGFEVRHFHTKTAIDKWFANGNLSNYKDLSEGKE